MDNQVFAWENYEENPNKMIGVNTIPTQKGATYNTVSNGVFTGSVVESFFTNEDKATIPQIASVIGQKPMEIVEGKGLIAAGVELHYITSDEEFSAAMGTAENPGWLRKAGYTKQDTGFSDTNAWAVGIVDVDCALQITVNGTTENVKIKDSAKEWAEVDNLFKRGTDHKYIIANMQEVFLGDSQVDDVKKIGFVVA